MSEKKKKKKDKELERTAAMLEKMAQEIKDVTSKFYLDGARVEFITGSQVLPSLLDSPAAIPFKGNEHMRDRCIQIDTDAKEKHAPNAVIDFFLNGAACKKCNPGDNRFRIMFRVTPEAAPVYLQEGEVGTFIKFFIDIEGKEAFLTFGEGREGLCYVIRLAEFHAIVKGYDFDRETELPTEDQCFWVSFSQAEGKYDAAVIFGFHTFLLYELFYTGDDAPSIPPASRDSCEEAYKFISALTLYS